MLRQVAKTQLFASVPATNRSIFNERLYYSNISRFATQSFVVGIMDLLSLAVYTGWYLLAGPLLPWHIAVHVFKIAVMALLFLVLSRRNHLLNYTPSRFGHRAIDIIYPLTHALLEFMLFATGPQDLGALVRFLAVPFIVGSIPVVRQWRIAPLQGGLYLLFSWFLIWHTGYAFNLIPPAYVLNTFLVACVCSVLVSNIVYSGYVNSFNQSMREQQDQAELHRLNDQLEIIARRDSLTGLSNRHDFDQYMALTWENARDTGESVTFISIDVDQFRLFCERFGPQAGDATLVKLTRAVQDCLGGSGYMFARYGSEEFIVAAYGEDHAGMVALAEKMRRRVEGLKIENPDSEAGPYLTISLGVVTRPAAGGEDYRDLIGSATECLAMAKRAGRNRVVHLDPDTGSHLDAAGSVLDPALPAAVPGGPAYSTEQLEQALRETALDCTFLYSRKHGTLEFSPHAQELLGTPGSVAEPTVGKIEGLLPLAADGGRGHLAALREAMAKHQRRAMFDVCLQIGQAREWVTVRVALAYGSDGEPAVASGSLFPIRNILAYSSYTYEQAMIDTVTLLPSRKRFYSDMDTRLSRGDASGYLLLFDISNFKSINSIFSHSIGDKTLRKVGGLITKLVEEDGRVYHYTTDQFILCVDSTAPGHIDALIGRVLNYFNSYDISIEGIPIRISFYVGAVRFGGDGQALDDLMVNLDIALQKAKLEHVRRFSLFRHEDKADYLAQMNLEKQLLKAIDDNFRGFALSYQPLFARGGRCIGAEALLRYRTPEGDLVSPLVVIPLLERAGLIDQAGRWVLAQACAQCRRWIDRGAPADFFVNVNLSAGQLEREDCSSAVFRLLEDAGLQPGNLVLEVTESIFLSEAGVVIDGLNRLRGAGVKIAIDDFGTGYSSFSYLRTLPADEIKIDKSFTVDADQDEGARRILLSIVMLLKGMGFMVCVEGVEKEDQMRVLKDAPIDLYQGFLFGKPEPQDVFERQWLG